MMLTEREKQEMLDFAKTTAMKAGEITLRYYGCISDIQRKADNSPVTIADKKVEEYIRREIATEYPSHSILGEEFERKDTGSEFQWIIDPIDGTSSFIRQVPFYGVLVAVLYKERPIIGVIHMPRLTETVCAAEGLGCYYNGTRTAVSTTDTLSDAWVEVTDYADLKRRRPDFTERLLTRALSCRTWGDAYGYLLVATGRVDVMIDPIMAPWDIAPLSPIISEAGGVFTDLDGSKNHMGTSAVACNRELHMEIMEII